MISSTREAALAYAAKGWSVIRITPGGKAPNIGGNWPSLATIDAAQIGQWFDAQPDANVGIVTNEAFGWVLDVDDLALLTFFAAKGLELPETLTAVTPSGGRHLVYQHPPGAPVRCRSDGGILARLRAMGYVATPGQHTLDTRGVPGGQIVVEPSSRVEGAYRWLSAETPIAEAPTWLLDLVRGEAQDVLDDGAVDRLLKKSPTRDLTDDEQSTLMRICAPVFDLTEGRYTALYEAATECARARLPFGQVLEALGAAADANGYAAQDARGAERQIVRGWALGWSQVEQLDATRAQVQTLREKMGFAKQASPQANDSENEICSDPAAARRVLAQLGGPDVVAYDEGAFWKYDDVKGVWSELSKGQIYAATEVALAHHVFIDKDIPEKLTIPFMGRVREALSLELTATTNKGFFAREECAVAVANGVLVVEQGRVALKPHEKDRRLRFSLPFEWDQHASAPLFEAALEQAIDRRTADTMAEWWGATLFGAATRYQRLLMLVGPGANGKGVILDACAALFERVAAVPPDKLGDDRMVAALAGVRLNLVTDISNRALRDTGPLKAAVTGDRLQGRDVYKSAISFCPICGFAYSANELPATNDMSDGFFRRFIIVPFDRVIPPTLRDPDLKAKIIANELPGILAWMVRGYLRLVTRGRYDTDDTALNDWRGDNDWLAEFIQDALAPMASKERGRRVSVEKVFGAYQAWAVRNGVAKPAAQKALTRLLKGAGWEPCRTFDKKSRALAAPGTILGSGDDAGTATESQEAGL